MQIEPIAHFHSPLTSKFGVPRQGGLVASLVGLIVFESSYRKTEAIRGLEQFSHLWMIWEFSANKHGVEGLTVRPPRLGGNERVGVFASRSPFRPNRLGLTCAEIVKIDCHTPQGPVIYVRGADLMDGTPIYDIKPYVRYADSHPEARSGFVDEKPWERLKVEIPATLSEHFSEEELMGLREILSCDPRPQYHHDSQRVYGMPYSGWDVCFRVEGDTVFVTDVKRL